MEPVAWWGVADDGAVFELVFPADLAPEVLRRWPPLGLSRSEEPIPGRSAEVRLGVGRDNVVDPDETPLCDDPSSIGWDRVEQELMLFAAQRMDGPVAIHAAVVESGGRAIVVPAASGAGKSTLCVAAHRAGARVLTDEYALVDPRTGLTTGWPRPVRLFNGVEVDWMDITVSSDPVPVALVAEVTYEPGAGADWAPMSRADATFALLDHALTARARPDDNLDAALVVARSARAVRGVRGEADAVIGALLAEAESTAG
jgi:hypothetical protein